MPREYVLNSQAAASSQGRQRLPARQMPARVPQKRLTPAAELMPQVRATNEFLVYEVQSRTDKTRYYRVDLECRGGVGVCECADCTYRKSQCWHLQQARKFLVLEVAQGAIQRRQEAAAEHKIVRVDYVRGAKPPK